MWFTGNDDVGAWQDSFILVVLVRLALVLTSIPLLARSLSQDGSSSTTTSKPPPHSPPPLFCGTWPQAQRPVRGRCCLDGGVQQGTV